MDELPNIPPEVLEQLIALSTLDEQEDQLAQQMARIQALRDRGSQRHTTGTGAALGAIGDALGGVMGATRSMDMQRQMAELLRKKEAGRQQYADLMKPNDYSDVPELEEAMPLQMPKKRRRPVLGALEGY